MSPNRGGPSDPMYQIGDAITRGVNGLIGLGERARARRARQHAEEEALAAALEERKRAERWLELVRQQMARGTAGYATQGDARDALRGRGGPDSNLDDIVF